MTECLLATHLKELAELLGKSINEIEREMNYPKNSLSNYIRGAKPPVERVLELAAYFGVSPEYLMGIYSENKILSAKRLFDHLDDNQKEEMYTLSCSWKSSNYTKENR